jgi:hypothetical protein
LLKHIETIVFNLFSYFIISFNAFTVNVRKKAFIQAFYIYDY